MDERFWPFPIMEPESEWDDFDRDYINFMRTSHAEGFRPREQGTCICISLGEWSTGRSASLVSRGRRNGWEPFLGDFEQSVRLGPSYNLPLGDCACVCVRPPFRGAGHLALEWMRGRSLEAILSDFEFVGGYPAGVVLRAGVIRPVVVGKA
jgi:hypothetical protein